MSHQDDDHLRKNIADFKAILQTAVPESIAEFTRHGNAVLDPSWLALVAVTCWGWIPEGTLTQRVSKACRVVGQVFGSEETVTRQGLLKAMATCGSELVELMTSSLTAHVMTFKGYWTKSRKVNVAVDGSKFAAPRTKENQAYFTATASGKKQYQQASDQSKASTVQVLLTICWHMTSGLPLRWITSVAHGSERKNAAQMLDHLPRQARLIGDAEYVGYPLWSKIHNSGRSFLVRVGSNVTLLENLGHYRLEDGFVSYWPEYVMDENDPPIVLRLFQIHDGPKAIFLVTNELDLSYEMACELYAARWKVEVFFRTVKQTCEQAKLHCLRPENVLTELNWTLLGIWYALYSGKKVLQEEGVPPDQLSPVKVMRAFIELVETIYRHATAIALFHDQLAKAVLKDESQRTTSKASRNYPRKKAHKRCRPPIINAATQQQRKRAKILQL